MGAMQDITHKQQGTAGWQGRLPKLARWKLAAQAFIVEFSRGEQAVEAPSDEFETGSGDATIVQSDPEGGHGQASFRGEGWAISQEIKTQRAVLMPAVGMMPGRRV